MPRFRRADACGALGGSWSATYWGTDPVHPITAGYRVIGAELINHLN
jgi:hypothetical protein